MWFTPVFSQLLLPPAPQQPSWPGLSVCVHVWVCVCVWDSCNGASDPVNYQMGPRWQAGCAVEKPKATSSRVANWRAVTLQHASAQKATRTSWMMILDRESKAHPIVARMWSMPAKSFPNDPWNTNIKCHKLTWHLPRRGSNIHTRLI